MDIDMEFECRGCGWIFTRSFLRLEHGRAVKCPFCGGAALLVRSETAVSENAEAGPADYLREGRYSAESKIKL